MASREGVGREGGPPIDMLVALLSSAFYRTSLEIASGADPQEVQKTVHWLLNQVIG